MTNTTNTNTTKKTETTPKTTTTTTTKGVFRAKRYYATHTTRPTLLVRC